MVQETFLIAFEKLEDLRNPEALRGWLMQIAVSRVHRRFRKRRSWRSAEPAETATCLAAQASPAATPEQRAELALLDRGLSHLSLPVRAAWILRRVEEHSLEDTAIACDCSVATVKRRIAKADSQVRAFIAGKSI